VCGSLILLLAFSVTYAQPIVKIRSLFLVGKGVAVSPLDPLDFKLAEIGIAKVTGNNITIKVGILKLDDEKYRIRNVTREEGKIFGYIYLNKTKIGEFELNAVIKKYTEVWAGTLNLNGKNYYLYILQGVRKIKPVELKEKIAEYCKVNKNDPNCRARISEFCKNNPSDSRCRAIFRNYCINNSEDMRCREYIIEYCKENPEKKICRLIALRRSAKFCEKHPNSRFCLEISKELVDYCLKHPNTERCRKFCAKYPDRCLRVVKSLADFCIDNPNHVKCIAYCKAHPKACKKLTKNLVTLCVRDPANKKCIDFCKAHPVACKRVSEELAKFCIGREKNPKCVNYCREHPGACKRIVIELEGYCAKNKDKEECKLFCSKYPAKCAIQKPIIAKEEKIDNIQPVVISKKIVSIVSPVSSAGDNAKSVPIK